MKRWLSLFLCAALLFALCACAKQSDPADNVTTTQPTQAEALTDPEPLYFALKSLPDIGGYNFGDKAATFFEDGLHDAFEPRDDYGGVLPYYTTPKYFREVPAYTWEDPDTGEVVTEQNEYRSEEYVANVGVMTTDGRCITGGVYDYFNYFENGGHGFFEFSKEKEDEMFEVEYVDIIAGDGSWCIRQDIGSIEYYPSYDDCSYFATMQGDQIMLFDLDGQARMDLTPYCKYSDYNERYELPNCVYCDDSRIMFEVDTKTTQVYDEDFDEYNEQTEKACVMFSLNGDELYRFDIGEDWVRPLTSQMLVRRESGWDDTDRLIDLNGQPISNESYDTVRFDEFTGTVIAYTNDGNRVDLLDESGAPLDADRNHWTDETGYTVSLGELLQGNACSVFFDDDLLSNHTAYTIYGDPIVLEGVEESDILYLDTQKMEDRSGNVSRAFLVETVDHRTRLFDFDGSLLFEIEPPARDVSDDDDSYQYVAYSVDSYGGRLVINTDDGRCILYDMENGQQTASFDNARLQPYWNCGHYEQWMRGDYFAVTEYNNTDDYNLEDSHTAIFHLPELSVTLDRVLRTEAVGNYILAYTAETSSVMNQDGTVVLKISNPDLI